MFDLWRAERRPTEKTWREFSRALDAFVEVAGDLPVRSIKKEHVREVKAALLQAVSKRDGKTPIKAALTKKLLNSLGAVLSWAEREGYIETNRVRGVGRVAALESKALVEDDRRLPFSVEQARDIIAKLPEGKTRFLWLLGFYSGARLSELAGLRQEDIREVDGVLCLDIRPHGARSLKNRASRRTIPIHPEVLKAGFSKEVLPFGSSVII